MKSLCVLLVSCRNMVCEGGLVALIEICITVYHVLLLGTGRQGVYVIVVLLCVQKGSVV